jgi:hypothetical protein
VSIDFPTFFIDSINHLVGIGTTNPSAKLYIKTTDLTTVPFQVEASISYCSAILGTTTCYRKPITINNTQNSNTLTNYQVLVTIDTASLISVGKMRSDCGDIRFTDSDGATVLNYWVESGCNTASTKIWVKVPSITASSTKTIYLYYGNPSASSTSNGDAVFDFFDDFLGTSLNTTKWGATGAYSIGSSQITITTGSVYSIATVASQSGSISEAKVKWNNFVSYSGLAIANAQSTQGGNGGSNKVVYLLNAGGGANVYAWAANGISASYNIVEFVAQFTATAGTTYIIGHAVTPSQVIFYKDRAVTNSYAGTWSAPFYLWLGYFTGSAAGAADISDIVIDWVLVRKYTSPEPTTSVGVEETSQQQQTVFYIQNQTGNVGIGTTTPTSTLHVNGTFTATGTKSATVETPSFGKRKLYAIESANVRFNDEGMAKLNNGQATIKLDPVYLETIEGDLLIHVTPYGNASLYVAERGADYFVVKSREGNDVEFAWQVSAFRKGYSNVRLEKSE